MAFQFICTNISLGQWDIKELGGMKSKIFICNLFAEPLTREDLLLGQWDIDKVGEEENEC